MAPGNSQIFGVGGIADQARFPMDHTVGPGMYRRHWNIERVTIVKEWMARCVKGAQAVKQSLSVAGLAYFLSHRRTERNYDPNLVGCSGSHLTCIDTAQTPTDDRNGLPRPGEAIE